MTDPQTEARAAASAIAAKDAKLAEINAHRYKVIAENERQMNALIESNRRIAALEAKLAEANKALETLIVVTKFELGDNIERAPWKRIVAREESALAALMGVVS